MEQALEKIRHCMTCSEIWIDDEQFEEHFFKHHPHLFKTCADCQNKFESAEICDWHQRRNQYGKLSFESVGVVYSLFSENVFKDVRGADDYYRLVKNVYTAPPEMVAPLYPPYMDGYKTREEAVEELNEIVLRQRAYGGPTPWFKWRAF